MNQTHDPHSDDQDSSNGDQQRSDQQKIDRVVNQKIRAQNSTQAQSKGSKIQFSPLHEGMGFHPFSDGLPYAPESKTKYKTGAGATSAGRPTFAKAQTFNQPSKPMGTARQLQQQLQPSLIATQTPSHSSASAGAYAAGPATFATPKILSQMSMAETLETAPSVSVVSEKMILRRRAFAYLMDTVIHAGFWLATNLTALFFFKFQIDSEILRDNLTQFLMFFAVSQWMFIALQEMLFETSIGKVFFNLEFKRNHGSLLLRSLVFMGGMFCFGIGLFLRPQDKLGKLQLKQKIYAS